jgi:hypothetical protein
MHKLLIVDDSPNERVIYQRLIDCYQLFAGSHQSLGSCDSLNFLKQYLKEPMQWPDILLLSLDMKEASDWRFLEEFEHLLSLINKKVDVYLACPSIGMADQPRIANMTFIKDRFLKPVSRHALIALHSLYQMEGERLAS